MPWVKGISGNPGGRRREKGYTEALRMVGAEEVQHPEDPSKKVRRLRLLAEEVFKHALAGEGWAVQHIADRLEGKPTQLHGHDSPETPTIQFVRQIVHVTKTREEIENESNDLPVLEHRPLEATEDTDASKTPQPIDPAPIDPPPPPDPGFPDTHSRPWRPMHQRPHYRRNGG
jgi:Family of unknown function (DUF5681)